MNTENREEQLDTKTPTPHHWKMRFLVALTMLALSFIGLVVSDVWRHGAWVYWRIMIPVFAVLSLFLSWYLRKNHKNVTAVTLWHELLHWIGLGLAVYLVSIFTNSGLIGRFEAGLMTLMLLSLTTFLSGIYVEPTFFVIGLLLGVFAAGASIFAEYVYTVMLPLTVVAILLVIWISRRGSAD